MSGIKFFPEFLGRFRVFQGSMGCCEAGNGDTIWGARDIVQSDPVAEVNGIRVTTLFTADTNLEIFTSLL